MNADKKVIFFSALIVVFLFAQFWFSKRVREPYPAVILPGFAAVPDVQHQIENEFLFLAVTNAGDSISVPTHQVFHDLIPWYHDYVMEELLRNDLREIRKMKVGNFEFTPVHRNINAENKLAFEKWLSREVSMATDRWDFQKIYLSKKTYSWNDQTHRGSLISERSVGYAYRR